MKNLLLLLLVSVLIFSGCKKDEPAGNADVTSISITVNYSDWERYSGDRYSGWEVERNVSEITDELISNGAIMVYEKYDGHYTALPYTQSYEDISVTNYFSFKPGKIFLGIQYNWEIIYNGEPPTIEYKVVFIENITSKSLNLGDYEEVKEYYNLVD